MSVACAVPEREGKSGGGGLLSGDDDAFKSPPGRHKTGNQLNQAPEYTGGSGRATRNKPKPLERCAPHTHAHPLPATASLCHA